MSKTKKSNTFRRQMAQSMAELRSIMANGQSPTGDGRLTVRTMEVVEPSAYDAEGVKKVRKALNVSQAVLARLVGVSDVLIRSWERGARQPAPIACRLLDQIRAHPDQFAKLVQPSSNKEIALATARPARRAQTTHRSRNGQRAA